MQLTVRDVVRMLKVSEKDVYKWIDEEELPAHQIDDQYRFNRAELLEWVTSRKIPVPPELFAQARCSGAVHTLTGALEVGRVFYGIQGKDKNAVLHTLAEAIPLPSATDRAHLLRILLAREALASTGVGDGIAIPHVRNPVIFPVLQPALFVFFLEQPVEFGALDGKPVHTLFTLVSPTVRTHLQLLSRLAFALRDHAFRRRIEERVGTNDLLKSLRTAESRFENSLSQKAQE